MPVPCDEVFCVLFDATTDQTSSFSPARTHWRKLQEETNTAVGHINQSECAGCECILNNLTASRESRYYSERVCTLPTAKKKKKIIFHHDNTCVKLFSPLCLFTICPAYAAHSTFYLFLTLNVAFCTSGVCKGFYFFIPFYSNCLLCIMYKRMYPYVLIMCRP